MLADLDLGQIFIIVIAVVAGFLQWLWKLIQQGKEEREQRNATPPDPEEVRQREEIWRRQVQEAPPRPPPAAAPPPLHDPWSTVREVFDKMKEEMRKKQEELDRRSAPPAAPPPLPAPVRTPPRPQRGTVAAELDHSLHPSLSGRAAKPVMPASSPVVPPPSVPLGPAPAVLVSASAPKQPMSGLRALLHKPDSLRQAILIREILGPPKALQSSGDAPF